MKPIRSGSVVQLRSGGELMTVLGEPLSHAKCAWIHNGVFSEQLFPVEGLVNREMALEDIKTLIEEDQRFDFMQRCVELGFMDDARMSAFRYGWASCSFRLKQEQGKC